MGQKSKKKVPRRPPKKAETGSNPPGEKDGFLIVAIGASAGGIEAFSELIRNLPADTGMAFVLVQHLDPKHKSILTEIVSRETSMRVAEAKEDMAVEPNKVYVIPPNAGMTILEGTLHLMPRGDSHGQHMVVDQFMRSLAEDQRNKAIGVILSGTGTDGTLGMGEIQAHGGVTFAQDETSAKYDGMPRSVIAAGSVDYVLPPKGIARELARIANHPYVTHSRTTEAPEIALGEGGGLGTIFDLLLKASGVDFSHYRRTTILRRIHRRMVVHKIDKLREYVAFLLANPAETKALYQDVLINVTSFFRNKPVFSVLKSKIFLRILKAHSPDRPIRIWTPACASGEETYSLAIALLEFLGDKASNIPVQFFGTDVSEPSIVKARVGFYPENIQGDVSAERLSRFFFKVDGGYRISKTVRDMCIFSEHNVTNDPPFSHMDLVCCRNLLIYLEPILQSKLIALFHYSLRPGGFLVLGTSEGIGGTTNLFGVEDRINKIFTKKTTSKHYVATFAQTKRADLGALNGAIVPPKQIDTAWTYLEAQKEFDRRLLTMYTPATVFVNADLDVIHSRGNVDHYLKLATGRASLSILKMAREGLLLELRHALNRAKKEKTPVRVRNAQVKDGGESGQTTPSPVRWVNFEVSAINVGSLGEQCYMITFEDVAPESVRARPSKRAGAVARVESEAAARRVHKLEQELASTRDYLNSVIENQESMNEELQSANEEILSSNEELQSTNEELETAKEELQSANEELTTVNDELRNRNIDVTQINNDLLNFLSSTDICMVMLSGDLSIRRFTPRAQKVLGLIPGDVGRPITSISSTIDISELQQKVSQVLAKAVPVEWQVRDRTGAPYQMRILPYITTENKVDGCVLTLVDVAASRQAEKDLGGMGTKTAKD
ncbi:MAG: chemotaxis protein CheB [Candidatus Acidiferrales bacterium]